MSNNTNSANVNNINSGANAITPRNNNNNARSNKNTVIIGNNNRENLNNRNRYPHTRDIYVPRDRLFEPIGILDPEGLQNNPFTNEPYQNLYDDPTK